MCGIFGWWVQGGAITPTQRSVLAMMLADSNYQRGRDSWGYYRPHTNELVRGLGSIMRGAAVDLVSSPTVMAHTRSATSGKVTIPNAHPYDFGAVVGAHNGIVLNHMQLDTAYKRDFEVDSMHIFAHLAQGLPLSEIHAWGAVEFYRRDRARMYLAAFGGQLGVFGLGRAAEPGQGIIWSSSDIALEGALEAARVEHFYPFQVVDGTLYCIGRDCVLYRVGPFPINRTTGVTTGRGYHSYRQEYNLGAGSHGPVAQSRLPIITPKRNGNSLGTKKPWVAKMPNESRKQFRRRRREVIEAWERDQAEHSAAPKVSGWTCLVCGEDDRNCDHGKRGDADDELVATVVQDAVQALKDRQADPSCAIEGGIVVVKPQAEVDPCV